MTKRYGRCIVFSTILWSSLIAQSKNLPQQIGERGNAVSDTVRLAWMKHFTSSGASSVDVATDVAVDAQGDIYVVGKCETPGAGNDYLTIKYDALGTELWRAIYDGDAHGNDIPTALRIDGSGNVYVTGKSESSVSFSTIIANEASSTFDYATLKYSPTGNRLWVVRYNGTGNRTDIPTAMALDVAGNVYVTGESDGESTVFPHAPLLLDPDFATVKYTTNGAQEWVARYAKPNRSRDCARGVALDDSGNVFVAGFSSGFDSLVTYRSEITTIKYGAQGETQWVKSIDASSEFGFTNVAAIVVDSHEGVYVTGYSAATALVELIKWNPAGQLEWRRSFADTTWVSHWPKSMSLTSERDVVVSGTGGDFYGNAGQGDFIFAVRYNAKGDMIWSTSYRNTNGDHFVIAASEVNASDETYISATRIQRYSSPPTAKSTVSLKYNPQGVLQWVQEYQSEATQQVSASAIDGGGNLVVVGGSGTEQQMDMLTLKYQSGGTQEWTRRSTGGGRSFESIVAMTFDAMGNVYVLGSSVSAARFSDFVTVKFDSKGNQLWAARYNSPTSRYDNPSAIAVDVGGNVIVAGFSADPGLYSTVKYDAQGEQVWTQSYQGYPNWARPPAHLGVDRFGNVYVAGLAGMVKYNSSGVQQWQNSQMQVLAMAVDSQGTTCFSTTYQIIRRSTDGVDTVLFAGRAKDIAVDDSANVYLTGSFLLPFDSASTRKISPSGAVLWAADGRGDRLFFDKFGNVFVGFKDDLISYMSKYSSHGAFQYTVDTRDDLDHPVSASIDDDGSIYAFGENQDNTVRLIKYGTSGTVLWQKEFRETDGAVQIPYAVQVDPAGNIYVAGNTEQMDMSTKITLSKLEQITVGVELVEGELPTSFFLSQNYPNPFNPSTTIRFALPKSGHVELKVYNTLGQEVATLVNEEKTAGTYSAQWTAGSVASGVYFYRLKAGEYMQTQKLMLLK